jgi:hypothetical protein
MSPRGKAHLAKLAARHLAMRPFLLAGKQSGPECAVM